MDKRIRIIDDRGSVMVEMVHEEITCWKHGLQGTSSYMGKGSDTDCEMQLNCLRVVSTFRHLVVTNRNQS